MHCIFRYVIVLNLMCIHVNMANVNYFEVGLMWIVNAHYFFHSTNGPFICKTLNPCLQSCLIQPMKS